MVPALRLAGTRASSPAIVLELVSLAPLVRQISTSVQDKMAATTAQPPPRAQTPQGRLHALVTLVTPEMESLAQVCAGQHLVNKSLVNLF